MMLTSSADVEAMGRPSSRPDSPSLAYAHLIVAGVLAARSYHHQDIDGQPASDCPGCDAELHDALAIWEALDRYAIDLPGVVDLELLVEELASATARDGAPTF